MKFFAKFNFMWLFDKLIFMWLFAILFFGLQVQTVSADDFQFSAANYKEAQKSPTYLRFDMKSTKLGFITTSFTGFVKKFTAHATNQEQKFADLKIEFNANDLDTDVNGRNEKMYDLCLNAKEHPLIDVVLKGPLPTTGEWAELAGQVHIKNKEKPILAKLKATNVDGRLIVDGNADLSIKELELPDPSIAIAKVDDKIKVTFHFEIPPDQIVKAKAN